MSEPPAARVVVDSNLLVRALLARHPRARIARLMEAILRRRVRLVTSRYVLGEVEQMLRQPEVRALSPTLQNAGLAVAVSGLRALADVVPGDFEVRIVLEDPRDDPILACALEGDAGWVVSDDHDLLDLKDVRVAGFRTIRVVDVALFLRLLDRNDV